MSAPVRYIDRTRDYYLGQGYDKPYEWAHHDDAPFTPLIKPLAESRVAIVSTSDIAIKSRMGIAIATTISPLAMSIHFRLIHQSICSIRAKSTMTSMRRLSTT